MTQIYILLSILAVKIYVMCFLMQMRRAGHAGVSIRNVKTTQIACIPVCILLHYIQNRLLVALIWSLYAGCAAILRWTLLSSINSAMGGEANVDGTNAGGLAGPPCCPPNPWGNPPPCGACGNPHPCVVGILGKLPPTYCGGPQPKPRPRPPPPGVRPRPRPC